MFSEYTSINEETGAVKIVGISGSLRERSYNTALLRSLKKYSPDVIEFAIVSIADIPLYNGDLEEAEGIPAAVEDVKRVMLDADGFMIVTPEYNHSIPGVLKNAIDWLSRPPKDAEKVFHGKAVAIAGVTPGGFGTVLAQNAFLPIVAALKMVQWNDQELKLSNANEIFDDNGNVSNENIIDDLRDFMKGYANFVQNQIFRKVEA